jgi:hypothetical protein
MTRSARLGLFATVVTLAAIAIALSVGRAVESNSSAAAVMTDPARRLEAPPERPFLMMRSLMPGETWSRVAVAPMAMPDGPRYVTPLSCDRVYFTGTRGVCLVTGGTIVPRYTAHIFDERFQTLSTLPLTGPPSRARLSRDGRFAAITVFEQGHSYAEHGFSTKTTLVDTASGTSLGDLEQFVVWREGARFQRVDFNFWGVTFTEDSNRFYATLAFDNRPHLVEGDVFRREIRILLPDVECPSLSPDRTRIAYKKRVPTGSAWEWRLWVMDLSTGSTRPVTSETRNIDDQVEWLDDTRLIYHFPSTDGNNLWVVDVDGTGPPQRYVTEAWSPAVVR